MAELEKHEIKEIIRKKAEQHKSRPIFLPLFIVVLLMLVFAVYLIFSFVQEQSSAKLAESNQPAVVKEKEIVYSLETLCSNGKQDEFESGIDCGSLCRKEC